MSKRTRELLEDVLKFIDVALKIDERQDCIEKPSAGYSVFKIQDNTLQHVESVGIDSDDILEPSGLAQDFFINEEGT